MRSFWKSGDFLDVLYNIPNCDENKPAYLAVRALGSFELLNGAAMGINLRAAGFSGSGSLVFKWRRSEP
jgi:hypothetical protein